MDTFSVELRSAMDAAGLSAAELAQRTGLTEGAISYLRSGRREPSFKSIRALSSALPDLAARLSQPRSTMDSIEAAIAEIRAGKMVIVLDDEDRENEGDVVMGGREGHARGDQFHAQRGRRADLRSTHERAARRVANSEHGARQHRAARHRVFGCRSKRAAASPPASQRRIARIRFSRCSIPTQRRATSAARPHVPLRARDGGVLVRMGRPKRRSISHGSRGLHRPA